MNPVSRLAEARTRSESKEKTQTGSISRILFLPKEATVIPLGRPLLAGSSDLTRGSAAGHRTLLFGLAPGGVCRASRVTPGPGELLPHRFTFAGTEAPAVYFLWHFPRLTTGRR